MVAKLGDPKTDGEVLRQLRWIADYRIIDNLDLPTLKRAARMMGVIQGLVMAAMITRIQQSGKTDGNHNSKS